MTNTKSPQNVKRSVPLLGMIEAMEASGSSPSQILAAVKLVEQERAAKARARVARCRNNKPANETLQAFRNVSSVANSNPLKNNEDRNVSSVSLARVRDNILTIEDTVFKKEKDNTLDLEFDEWYVAYPRHVGRGQALRAYRTARKKVTKEVLLRGAREAHSQFKAPYIPYPASWLNGEHWADEEPKGNGAYKSIHPDFLYPTAGEH